MNRIRKVRPQHSLFLPRMLRGLTLLLLIGHPRQYPRHRRNSVSLRVTLGQSFNTNFHQVITAKREPRPTMSTMGRTPTPPTVSAVPKALRRRARGITSLSLKASQTALLFSS